MKNKYLFIIFALGFFACEGEVVDYEEDKEIKFPFEALDQSNFISTSSTLNAAPLNVRLDSVVYLHYYQFNPETNSDDFSSKAKNALPAPPEPTNRRSEHFNYNENKQLISKYSYYNYEYDTMDLTEKGELQFIEVFEYDSKNNLAASGYQLINDSGTINNTTSYVYNDLNILKESITNGSIKKFNKNNNQLEIEEITIDNESKRKNICFLDSFNNISKFRYALGTQYEFENIYNYPKNIYNPYVNLFPKNFYPFLILSEFQGGFSHLSSGSPTKFNQQIKVNSQGFPELIQYGSYDNGDRTLYYYSKY